MDRPAWTNDAIAERLQNLFADEEVETSDTQWAYREAAAVRVYYELNDLRPARVVDEGTDAATVIGGDSDLTYDDQGEPRWTLRPGVRREAIKRLQDQGRLRETIEANPARNESTTQRTLESYLLGTAKPLESQALDELRATARVAEFLRDVVETLPDPARLAQRLERETFLAPLRALVGDHFAGRQAELDAMTDYVAALGPSGLLEKALQMYESAFSVEERPALFVYGPGGIGKSTLVAKFILDHTDVPEDQRIPFAYFDFDRPGLIAEEPITLLFEALRQFGAQYPESKPRIESVRKEWALRVADSASRTEKAAASWKNLRLTDRDHYVESFAGYVQSLGMTSQPVLFVLDTLEEVQLRSQPLVEELLAFLAVLQLRIPRLRTVLSGRVLAESTRYPIQPLALKTFDRPSASAFLQLKVRGLAADVADAVAKQVGGSPLTLKLAVAVLNQDADSAGPEGIKGLHTGLLAQALAKIRGENIQSQLYTRILGHIKNDQDVKKLAHPGLILRRITPQLILKVLAEPCGVHVPDLATARKLVARLAKQVVLVTESEQEVLIHRPDLRAVMLEPLRNADKARVETIQRRAIDFYQPFDDPDSRAEEIYHRLALGEDRAVVNARWMQGLKKPLQNALDELPAASQAFLAAKLDLDIEPKLWAEAHQEDWEIYAARRAQDHLKFNRPNDALAAVTERERSTWTPGSTLHAIWIDALIRLGHLSDARAAFDAVENQWDRFDAATRSRLETQRGLLASARKTQPTKGLSSSHFRMLLDALLDAVPNHADLEKILPVNRGRALLIAPQGSLEDAMFMYISAADAQGWLGDLIVAARNVYPANRKLFAIAQELGLSSAPIGSQIEMFLEKTGRVLDPEEFRRRLTIIEGCVCRIEVPAGKTVTTRTGFLIGPNVVLTSYHAVAPFADRVVKPSDIVVRFDYRGDSAGAATSGASFQVGSLIGSSMHRENASEEEQLDYALLRLLSAPGFEPGANSTKRGWLTSSGGHEVTAGAPIAVVYFASDGSLNLTLGIDGVAAVDSRGHFQLRLSLPPDSWGAPCFNAKLQLMAMVQADSPQGRRRRRTGPKAVPIDRIMKVLEGRGEYLR